jgi:2-oxoisovalerate dehydrogenase E1 component beta subunit
MPRCMDVRTLMPLDVDTICDLGQEAPAAAWSRTRRRASAGYGAELCASIQEACFWHLEAPIMRVAGWDTPYPHAFEWEYFPGPARVAIGLKAVMETP